MATVECTATALEAARNTVGEAEPVYMINMVRYRDQADYEGRLNLPACSGREAYFQRYAPAFNKIAQSEDYGVFWVGNVRDVLVAPEEERWDDIVIVRYSSFSALRRIGELRNWPTKVVNANLARTYCLGLWIPGSRPCGLAPE